MGKKKNSKRRPMIVLDVDKTLIYPERYKQEGDVCVEIVNGKETSFANPENLKTLARLSTEADLVLITARTREQFKRIKFPDDLQINTSVINLGADLYFSKIEGVDDWKERSDKALQISKHILPQIVKHLSSKSFVKFCEIRDNRFVCARFSPGTSLPDIFWCRSELVDYPVQSYLDGEKLYVIQRPVNKGYAVTALAKTLKPSIVIAVGDSESDIPMLAKSYCAILPDSLNHDIFENYYGKGKVKETVLTCNCYSSGVREFTNYAMEALVDVMNNWV